MRSAAGRPTVNAPTGAFCSLSSEPIIIDAYLWLQALAIRFPGRSNGRTPKLPRKPNFARYLRDARLKRGLSVAEVAEQVGVSQSSIYFWETDYCRPRDANLTALCKTLKLPIRATREIAAAR